MTALNELLSESIDDSYKGIPGGHPPFPLAAIGEQGFNVMREDLPFPLMVLKKSVLDANISAFREFLESKGVSFAPHGKTTMAPQLFHRQIEEGAWGITAANISQMIHYRRFGIQRVLLANQLVGRQNVRYVIDELNRDPDFDFFCLADSVALVRQISELAVEFSSSRPIKCLIEIGEPGGRTGCRSSEEALEVLAALKKLPGVTPAGVEGFEGVINEADPAESTRKVDAFLNRMRSFLESLSVDDFEVDEVLLSAGGSAFFDRVADILAKAKFALPVRVVVRSGCYITHDSGGYDQAQTNAKNQRRSWCRQLRPALEIWSYVQSLPEKGVAILTMGKRDCPYDSKLPIPQSAHGALGQRDLSACNLYATNDQHAYMSYPQELNIQVGDRVSCGISHPCTAFDKWRLIPIVDDDYNVIDGIRTFF